MKILQLFVVVFLLNSPSLFAQETSYIGFESALTASHFYLIGSSQVERAVFSELNSQYDPILGRNTAITYDRKISRKLFFKVGLELANHAYLRNQFILSTVEGVDQRLIEASSVSTILIPVSLRVEMPFKKVRPFIEAGIAPTYLAKGKIFRVPLNRIGIASNLAVGANIQLSEKFIFSGQLHAQALVSRDQIINGPSNISHSIGLRTGVKMAI